MESLKNLGSVKKKAAFFESFFASLNSFTPYPDNEHPLYRSSYLDHSDEKQVVGANPAPVELSAACYNDPNDTGPLGRRMSEMRDQYFDRAPINTWFICKELQKAISFKTPLSYQAALLDLLTRQTQAIDELCIGINHGEKLFRDPNEAVNFLHDSNAPLEIRPTIETLQQYPRKLIDVIEQFLNHFYNFHCDVIQADYNAFIELDDNEATKEVGIFFNRASKQHVDILASINLTYSREELNNQFEGRLKHRLAFTMKQCREALNSDFREMMKDVLFTLLFNIRKEQLLNMLWRNCHPKVLLRNVSLPWIRNHQDLLKDYLIRKDSSCFYKEIPIEHPFHISYTAWKDGEPLKRETKVDNIERWINRILRCGVHPFGNIQVQAGQLGDVEMNRVLASNRSFIEWLRKDPSLSFAYVNQEDTAQNTEQKIIFTVDIAYISNVKDDYFKQLSKIVQYDNHSIPNETNSEVDVHNTNLSYYPVSRTLASQRP